MSPGAPRGPANGNYRHGLYTREHLEMMAEYRRVMRAARLGLRGL